MMKLLRKYRIVFFITLPLLILLTARTYSPGSFKYDARKWAEPSFNGKNIVRKADMLNLPGNKLIVNLDRISTGLNGKSVDEISIQSDSVLIRKYLEKIKDHKGAVIISSSDPSLSARIWMLISQTGCKNLYILADSIDNEAFKSEFRSDTIVKPEL
jgi:hypothetical protein